MTNTLLTGSIHFFLISSLVDVFPLNLLRVDARPNDPSGSGGGTRAEHNRASERGSQKNYQRRADARNWEAKTKVISFLGISPSPFGFPLNAFRHRRHTLVSFLRRTNQSGRNVPS
ncbi:hypothetical protein BKA93DRAFT_63245 [Sparassis latifolia]